MNYVNILKHNSVSLTVLATIDDFLTFSPYLLFYSRINILISSVFFFSSLSLTLFIYLYHYGFGGFLKVPLGLIGIVIIYSHAQLFPDWASENFFKLVSLCSIMSSLLVVDLVSEVSVHGWTTALFWV